MVKSYRYWASQKGNAINVKQKKFLGLRGYNGYVLTKEHDGILYAGEIWECVTEEGDYIQCVFRIPYEDIGSKEPYGDRTDEIQDFPNYHTDGIKAFETNRLEDRDRTQLLKEIDKLRNKINTLKDLFYILHPDNPIKIGVQLYLRRLENPTNQTSREWKAWCNNNRILQSQIMNIAND